ncbi:TPA: hypothetical protein U3Z39_001158 [Klebsiella pneumoniae]|nr:hypothetical protein [Klebsiella pneumoniae]
MCRNHGNLVDADHSQYTVEMLKTWKNDAELAAYNRLSQPAQLLAVGYSPRDLNILKEYCSLFNYGYLQQLKNELFRAKVPTSIIDPLYTCMSFIDNPSYQFNAVDLENLRQELNSKVLNFNQHFGAESGGNIDYYDYIDLNLIRQRSPSRVDYYVNYIQSTQKFAYEISEVALKLLNIQAKTGNI